MTRVWWLPLRILSAVALSMTVFMGDATCLAGTLTNGIWKADGCGDEPPAPVLHTESSSAYKESLQWVQLYQQRVTTYEQCVVKEANADVDAVNTAVRASQHRANDAFKQFNEASKEMSEHSGDESAPSRHTHGGQGGSFSFGSGGE